ncbi:helix-turn-helix domain-containing protein [Orrella sp. 11846]|uniref:helix-turn-helix domain-containing protein n=1 Tax=Orrella sp. 11846 TaxID=3409913 RepID=UPI003B596BFA
MTKRINPIVRALDLLRALNRQPQNSLSHLHRVTGLPKSTVHRILATLKSEGYVQSDIGKGMYSLTEKVRSLSVGYTDYDLTVELGANILLKITRQTGLPLAIGTIHGGRILVRYSSMPYSPIGSEHTTVGHEHNLLESALGQAYLGFCSEAERQRLTELLISAASSPEQIEQITNRINRTASSTQQRGYGFRASDTPGSTTSIAIPLKKQDEILGALSLTTFSALITHKTTQECLTVLQTAATEIIQKVSDRLTP